MARGKGRDRELESRWRGLLREQSRSGLGIRRFCAARGLRETSFHFWRREIQRRREETRGRRSPSRPQSSAGLFLPVVVAPESSSLPEGRPIEIVLGDAVVRVPARFDADSLVRVVEVLRTKGLPSGRGGEVRSC